MRFKGQCWDDLTNMGCWVNLDNPYIFENDYGRFWALLKKLLRQRYTIKVYPAIFSSRGTGLSSHEQTSPAPKMVKDATIVASSKIEKRMRVSTFVISRFDQRPATNERFIFLPAWTTTPGLCLRTAGGGENRLTCRVRTSSQYTFRKLMLMLFWPPSLVKYLLSEKTD